MIFNRRMFCGGYSQDLITKRLSPGQRFGVLIVDYHAFTKHLYEKSINTLLCVTKCKM